MRQSEGSQPTAPRQEPFQFSNAEERPRHHLLPKEIILSHKALRQQYLGGDVSLDREKTTTLGITCFEWNIL